MTRSIKQSLKEFEQHWKNYVFQSLLATAAILMVMLFLKTENLVIVATIGATTFIVYAMPKSITARSKSVIGGYLAGILCGSAFALLPVNSVVIYSLAVGLSIFIMVVADIEHPPASAIALDFAIRGFSLKLAIAVMASVIILSLVRRLFKKHLRDLT